MPQIRQRIQFIDAMRGFTMFLVVLGHIFVYTFNYDTTESVVSSFFITFRMPMFFFISGYIGYKAVERWNGAFYWQNLRKKAYIQLIPGLIFLFVYCISHDKDYLQTVLSSGLNINWFTEVLFEMFLVYFTTAAISRKVSERLFTPVIVTVAAITTFIISFCFHANAVTDFLWLRAFCRYFQFFALGLICRKYNDKFMTWITKDTVKTILIIVFIALFLTIWEGPFAQNSAIWKMLHDLVIRYVGLFMVFAIFASHQEYFDADGRISRTMQFVGKRTLDIYLLHYFFLPDLQAMKPYFINNDNPTFELITAAVIAAVVLTLSLATSSILRQSDFLAAKLFGVKTTKATK